MAKFKELYNTTIKKALTEKFQYNNPMQVPKLEKLVINMGIGEAAQDQKQLESAVRDLTEISGRKPVITRAKKSIAGFKLRQGMPIGCKVTLRGTMMYEFLERFVYVAMPRVRDFRGISGKNFDGNGNFAIGFKEQIIFPEIDYDKIDKIRGLDVVIVTSANTDEEAKALLAGFNFPFANYTNENA